MLVLLRFIRVGLKSLFRVGLGAIWARVQI